jgi:hypothetical protein
LTANCRIRVLFVATIAVTAAVVAGCSSADTKNEYVDTVNQIQTDALQAVNQSTTTQPNSKAQVVEQLESAEKILGDAVTELEQVDVPEEAQGGHEQLVAGIDEMRGLFADTAEKVKSASSAESVAELTSLVGESSAIGAEIDAAITQINQDLGAE